MKIIAKTYLLVGILIAVGAINLFLLYEIQQGSTNVSQSIIKAVDLKVKAETISGLANSIASGNENDIVILETEVNEYQMILDVLQKGGTLEGQTIIPIPQSLNNNYNELIANWDKYKETAEQIKTTAVFDENTVKSLNYVLEKNGDLIILTSEVQRELESLDRDFNRHKEISNELKEIAKEIGQLSLLISIGEEITEDGTEVKEQIKQNRLKFESGLRKLTGIPINDIDLKSINVEHEELETIPRENSSSLRELDPLWEAIQLRVKTIEERSILSPEFAMARSELQTNKITLLSTVDVLLENWNKEINKATDQQEGILQILLGVDIAVFVIVIIVIRQSLSPLDLITHALSRVKEGVYGEKINYSGADEVGELVGNFNIMSDTIKEKEEEAKENSIAKDEFLAMITHELKTPLVPIQGYVDLLLNEHLGKLTEKQKERLKIIKSSSKTLLEIISDLLDAQKLELGQLRIKKETSSIKNTIEDAVTAFLPESEQKQIQLTYQSPEITITHDKERINQVLGNLIKNSMNSVNEGTGTINIQAYDQTDKIKIDVTDNGIGIPQDKQNDLFKKFYQVDASLTRERGGSGLGLAICKGIIEAHNGELTVQSTENMGSTFSFTLPKTSDSINSETSAAI